MYLCVGHQLLIHDPNALLRFDEQDVVLPIVVFEASERSRLAAHVAEVL